MRDFDSDSDSTPLINTVNRFEARTDSMGCAPALPVVSPHRPQAEAAAAAAAGTAARQQRQCGPRDKTTSQVAANLLSQSASAAAACHCGVS